MTKLVGGDYAILSIEDNPADAVLLQRCLQRIPEFSCQFVHCAEAERGVALLDQQTFDFVFLDQQLGAVRGVEVLRLIRQAGCETPVVLFTGHGSEEVAVEAMRAGAQDYLNKSDLSPQLLQLTMENIGEKQTLEKNLRENRAALERATEELDRFFNLSPDMFCITDAAGRIQSFNPAWTETLGYSADELLAMALLDLVHPDDRAEAKKALELVRVEAVSFENRCRRADGDYRWLRWSASAQKDGARFYATARDITVYRQTHNQLEDQVAQRTAELTERNRELEKYQERLRLMASSLALTEERERRRLAEDLHDSIGQDLALSKGKIAMLSSAEKRGESLGEISELLDRVIQNTRTLTFELSPPILHELGLEAAIEWQAEQLEERHGIRVEFTECGVAQAINDDRRIVVFRVVRELLLNVVKHASARRLQIDLVRDKDTVHIAIEDDGCGFAVEQVTQRHGRDGGFGLFSIHERIEALGGTLFIDSTPGRGTRVALTAPLGDRRRQARERN